LRTSPATPYPSEDCGEKENKYKKDYRKYRKQYKILRPKDESEYRKLTVKDIQQEKGFTIYFDPWKPEKNDQQDYAYNDSGIEETSFRTSWKKAYTATRRVHVVQLVAKFL
jgi:hypothetical protein